VTFCGDWAGQDSIFQGAGCPGTCVGKPCLVVFHNEILLTNYLDYVNNNPEAFSEAYFDFASIKVYQ